MFSHFLFIFDTKKKNIYITIKLKFVTFPRKKSKRLTVNIQLFREIKDLYSNRQINYIVNNGRIGSDEIKISGKT